MLSDIGYEVERENVFVKLSIAGLFSEVCVIAAVKIKNFTWKLFHGREHKNVCLMGIHICIYICLVI